ncbi:MAG TPA: hypothetical protein VMV69_10925 [Pirellulales bacterium]|nr:hypothetical protein [Pirellulales bacterium]
MKKTILLLAAVAGAGYYLHWFNFTTSGTGTDEHINITLDKTKIHADESKAVRVLKLEGQRIQQDAALPGPANGSQPASDPNQQSAGAARDANATPSGPPAYDPYAPNPPAAQPGYAPTAQPGSYAPTAPPGYAPPRSAKRQPPSELDQGFE